MQTLQTQIRLQEQFDQGLLCLPFPYYFKSSPAEPGYTLTLQTV